MGWGLGGGVGGWGSGEAVQQAGGRNGPAHSSKGACSPLWRTAPILAPSHKKDRPACAPVGAENSRSQLRSGSERVEAALPSEAACTRSDKGQYLARVPAGTGPHSSSPASGLYLSSPHSCRLDRMGISCRWVAGQAGGRAGRDTESAVAGWQDRRADRLGGGQANRRADG